MRASTALALLAIAALLPLGCGEDAADESEARAPTTAAAPDPATKASWDRAVGRLSDACFAVKKDGGRERLATAADTRVGAYAAYPDYEYPLGERHGDGPSGAVPITLREELHVAAVDARDCAPDLSLRLETAIGNEKPAPTTALEIKRGSGPSRTITCPGDRQCAQLEDTPHKAFDPVPDDVACTQIYGGPETATVSGTLRGKRVMAKFSRQNGCEIGRWERLEWLLGRPSP